MAEVTSRTCVACTLVCSDAARLRCELCGADLPPRASGAPTCIDLEDCEEELVRCETRSPAKEGDRVEVERACPACTLVCTDISQSTCELCRAQLPAQHRTVALSPELRGQSFGRATKMDRVDASTRKKSRLIAETGQRRSVLSYFGASPSCASSPANAQGENLSVQVEYTARKVSESVDASKTSQELQRSMATSSSPVLSEADFGADPTPSPLTEPLHTYQSATPCWSRKEAALPYRHLAAALDALEATRSRLLKEVVLTNTFRSMLAMKVPPDEVEAGCYLLAPTKDAQAGGHRLQPEWAEQDRPLSIPQGCISTAVLEATGGSRGELRRAYGELRDLGETALALRERGGRQRLLRAPPPLTAGHVRSVLLSLSSITGPGTEKRKTQCLVGLLRAAVGTELKWLVRTFLPHMAAGISLEASVLPALGAAWLIESAGKSATELPCAKALKDIQDVVRTGFALRPDVGALVRALLEGGVCGVERECTLHLGVPMQPMLAKPSTSIDDLITRIVRALPLDESANNIVQVAAEYKYDGQRAQIHCMSDNKVRIYSRKIDDITFKYPDVVAVIQRCRKRDCSFLVDAEIVAVSPTHGAAEVDLAAFQSLSTRKRKHVTEANAAASSVPVKVFFFDLLWLAGQPLLSSTFAKRREAMRAEFVEERGALAFATVVDVDIPAIVTSACTARNAGSAAAIGATLNAARDTLNRTLREAVAGSCEGLMVKRLDSIYEPSTKRSDCWLKLKKDYIESLGDSLDLVPIGGWRGSGRKSRWVSPWLLATYDPIDGVFGSVCRVMSGFSDQFYKENTIRYLGAELHVGKRGVDAENDDGGGAVDDAEPDADGDSDAGTEGDDESDFQDKPDGVADSRPLLRTSPAAGVETAEQPQYWFEPSEVWEIRGADITISPKHMAARGLVHPDRGLSLRFPRFARKRPDKRVSDATTPDQLAALFRAQTQQR